MGSIGCQRPKGLTDKQFFEQEYSSFEVLDTSRIGGVIYAACRKRDTFEEGPMRGEVFALVMPFSSGRDGSFVWKEQDETIGPYDTRCPERILDLLTPTDSDYANEWRAKCRETAKTEAAAKQRAKQVKPGTVIRTEPLNFTSGATYDTFRFQQRSTFVALDSDGYPAATVSLTGWKNREYEVVS